MLISFLSTHPCKCSFSLLTFEFSVLMKLFFFKANEGEIKTTGADAKFSAVSQSRHMQDLLRQRLAESNEAASSSSVSGRVPGAEVCIPAAHWNHQDAFKTTDARTAGVKTCSVSNTQPRLRTPPNCRSLTCKPVFLIAQAPSLGVSHLFSCINCLKVLDCKCSFQNYN